MVNQAQTDMFGDSDRPRQRMLIGGGRSACFPVIDGERDEETETRIWANLRLDRMRTPSKRLS